MLRATGDFFKPLTGLSIKNEAITGKADETAFLPSKVKQASYLQNLKHSVMNMPSTVCLIRTKTSSKRKVWLHRALSVYPES